MDLRIRIVRGHGGLTARVRILDANGVAWRTYLLPDDGETVTLSQAQEQAAQHAEKSLKKIHGGRVPAHALQLMMEIEMPQENTSRCGECLAYLPTQESEEGTCWETGNTMLAGAVACGKFRHRADYPILTVRAPR